jgi:thiol-disulfide isomerase/thioredoxin
MTRFAGILIGLAAVLAAYNSYSQAARTVTGIVTSPDEPAPLEGVTVATKSGNNISGTQADGIYYIIVTPKDSVLVFSYAGFQTLEIEISTASEYNVVLEKATGNTSPDKDRSFSSFPYGVWRGVFQIREGIEVPFNFEIKNTPGESTVYFLNAEERFEGGRLKITGDSLFILLDPFDNELAFRIDQQVLTGVLRRQDKSGFPIPVKAEWEKTYRFEESGTEPDGNITGTYAILFKGEDGKEEKAVGLFTQQGKRLSATFLRVTGDSRYLEGIVEGNNFYLSSFIGSGPGYYKGSFEPGGRLTGEVIGARGRQAFTGLQNEEAALPDPYRLTYLKEGYTSFDFAFPDTAGRLLSPKDNKYKNKVVIVTITGTWCPNCMDEAAFLAPWYKENKNKGVEIISIHYERQTDPAFVKKVITRFREKFDIRYDEVFAGPADKQYVVGSLPALNTFLSFPTTIFIDKKGKVAKIHTGYTGPATGKYYDQFVKEFNEEVDQLLKQ